MDDPWMPPISMDFSTSSVDIHPDGPGSIHGSPYLADSESTTTAPSLFGEDGPGTPQFDPNTDFFRTISQGSIHIPHMNYGLDSSVAATIGSSLSSVTSELLLLRIIKVRTAWISLRNTSGLWLLPSKSPPHLLLLSAHLFRLLQPARH
jgi:hypothetical protein